MSVVFCFPSLRGDFYETNQKNAEKIFSNHPWGNFSHLPRRAWNPRQLHLREFRAMSVLNAALVTAQKVPAWLKIPKSKATLHCIALLADSLSILCTYALFITAWKSAVIFLLSLKKSARTSTFPLSMKISLFILLFVARHESRVNSRLSTPKS